MPAAEDNKTARRCHHCGREVAETVHTRSAYYVDYYTLHTGAVEPTTIPRPDDPTRVMTIFKLLRPATVTTCADCYQRPAVREQRELLFRSELAAAADGATA